jgi:hypothetical protein
LDQIAHIDVAEESRIAEILAVEGNHSWPAIDCESMDGWVPDLGLTGYANHSIYRPPAIVAAGVTTTVRHRFRVPMRNPKLPGTYFLGALIYDQVGEEFPLEINLGSQDVGRIEPRRHDNRRHLIVIDQPITFDNRVKWVQFTSSGRGACRIEQFVLLLEAPESSSFVPNIERTHVEVGTEIGSGVSATVHCVTYPPATVVAVAEGVDGDRVESAPDGPSTLHALELPGLQPRRTYVARLTATEPDGKSAEASSSFDTAGAAFAGPAGEELEASVELCNLSSSTLEGLPLRFGVPVRRAAFFEAPPARLEWDGGAAAVQSRIISQYPDGSARWLLVDSSVPPALSADGRLLCQLRLGAPAEPAAAGVELHAETDKGGVVVSGQRLRAAVDPQAGDWLRLDRRANDGTWSVGLAGGRLDAALAVVLADGTPLSSRAEQVAIEHDGPLHTTVRFGVLHADAEGATRLRSELRVHVFAAQPFVTLDHRLMVVRGDPRSAPLFESGKEEEDALLALQSYSLRVPSEVGVSVELGSESFSLDKGQSWRLQHEHDLEHRLTVAGSDLRRPGRASGHVRVRTSTGETLVGIRNFWQRYPKGIAVVDGAIHVDILPALSGDELPGDEDAWQRLYRWLQNGTYLLREGMALSSEVLLGFADDADSVAAQFAWLETPVAVRPTVEYANATGALPRLADKAGSPDPDYERLAGDALTLFRSDRENWRAYGHVNFGDWYGEGDWSWGNNEYDTPFGAYLEFLRGGDPGWATWGGEAARHLADVDTVNCFHDERHVGLQSMHMPAHLGGYLPAFFRSKIAGTRGVPSHMWAEGPLLHYLLTGDEAVRDSLTRSASWLLQPQRLDHYDFTSVREAGWHLIHLSMIASATNDRRALNGAAIVVKRILEKQDESGGWTRMLTSGHCHCGYPHCRGNIAFMVTVLVSGLKRYHDLTLEPAVANAILAGARWLIRETFNEETGHFFGGSCTTMQRHPMGDAYNTRIVLEGIADAYAITGDPELGRCLKRTLPAMRVPIEIEGHRDLGKRLSDQMRYVPTILAAVETRPLGD